MADAPTATPDTDAPTTAERVTADIAATLARIERERRRVRPEDWRTLFRQLQRALSDLSGHPFVAGDREAETRLARVMLAADLADMDRKVDALAEYLLGKLEFNLALRRQDGRAERAAAPRYVGPPSTTSDAARAQARHGPSGSDFDLPGTTGPDAPAPRRSVFRL